MFLFLFKHLYASTHPQVPVLVPKLLLLYRLEKIQESCPCFGAPFHYHESMSDRRENSPTGCRPVRLDLGAGRIKRDGYFSVDKIRTDGVDIVCNLEGKLPFLDDTIDEIFSRHLFEHIQNLIPLFEEVYRVCRSGAKVIINVPYYTSVKAYKDPTHVNFFTERTFEYFEGKNWENFEFPFRGSYRVVKIDYLYERPFHRLLPFMSFWRRVLMNTVTSMIAELEVVKK